MQRCAPRPRPRPRHRRVAVASALVAVALLAGCGPASRTATRLPVVDPSAAAPSGPEAVAAFAPCPREPADESRTSLRPSALTPEEWATVPWWGSDGPDGRLVVEHVADLPLPDGVIGTGSGFDGAVGVTAQHRRVADGPAMASVTLSILDSPTAGRRVAFVEAKLTDQTPVRWEEDVALAIGTDGGDGALIASSATDRALDGMTPADDAAVDAYLDAFSSSRAADPGSVCLVRTSGEVVDGVLFATGYGDGGYPTAIGFDAQGAVASVVSVGGIVPWALGGFPGVPPARAQPS